MESHHNEKKESDQESKRRCEIKWGGRSDIGSLTAFIISFAAETEEAHCFTTAEIF